MTSLLSAQSTPSRDRPRTKLKYRSIVVPFVFVFGLVGYFGLFNYQPFVDFVFEFGDSKFDGEFDPANSAIAFDSTLSQTRQIDYAEAILQPSGVSIRGDRMLIVTDTSDVYLTDLNGDVIGSVRVKGGPLLLRQGFAEGVVWTSDTTAAVIAGEGTRLILLSVVDQELSVDQSISLDLDNPSGSEVQAIGYDDPSRRISLALATVDGARILWLDQSGHLVGENNLSLPGLDPETQDVQGAEIRDQSLFLLLKRNVVAKIDLAKPAIVSVSALDYTGDTSGIAVAGDELFVVTDHEFYDEQPDLRVFQLPGT